MVADLSFSGSKENFKNSSYKDIKKGQIDFYL